LPLSGKSGVSEPLPVAFALILTHLEIAETFDEREAWKRSGDCNKNTSIKKQNLFCAHFPKMRQNTHNDRLWIQAHLLFKFSKD
jgi:hypothetical protein